MQCYLLVSAQYVHLNADIELG